MKKTDTFFVIDNFNTVPIDLLNYCEQYKLYDASTDMNIPKKLSECGIEYEKVQRTGHNISVYFKYFIDYYEILPEWLCLTRGHMIGRHCSKEFFERVYRNKYFTYLYSSDKNIDSEVAFLSMNNIYLERNDSWNMYISSPNHPHKYFDDYNRLLKFIYQDPVLPRYCQFAPGACYIISKNQVLKHTKAFYKNLNKIMTYGLKPNFPSEAHQIERMLPIIWEANYKENEWMNDENAFDKKICEEEAITRENDKKRLLRNKNRFGKLLKINK